MLAPVLLTSLLYATPQADDFSVQVPGGGSVEVIAIGDTRGNWWEPNGQPLESVDFKIEGLSEQDPKTTRCFLYKVNQGTPSDLMRFSPGIERNKLWGLRRLPMSRGDASTIHDLITDLAGKRLEGLAARTTNFNPSFETYDHLKMNIRFGVGAWSDIATAKPVIVANQSLLPGSVAPTVDSTLEATYIDPQSGFRGHCIAYRENDRRGSASLVNTRAIVEYTDGKSEELRSSVYGTDVRFGSRFVQPTGSSSDSSSPRSPDEITSITLQSRPAHVLSISNMAPHPVVPLNFATWHKHPKVLYPVAGIAALLVLCTTFWLIAKLTARVSQEPPPT